jgi:hypothetical protein
VDISDSFVAAFRESVAPCDALCAALQPRERMPAEVIASLEPRQKSAVVTQCLTLPVPYRESSGFDRGRYVPLWFTRSESRASFAALKKLLF